MTLLSYHNDTAVKAKYVARFEEHRRLDQVIQGTGFDNGRGCFVGCTLDAYDHSRFPVELGWPEWLARLADAIFEGLPKEDAPQFGTDLLAAVPVGVDLEPARHLLALRRIDRLIALQRGNLGKHGEQIDSAISGSVSALETVRRCHEAEIGGSQCDWAESAESARSAAWAAARSAWAAESAAWAAESAAWAAESAAWAAESAWAADSAWAAARSAWAAARSAWAAWAAESAWAARSAAYRQERDDLIEILQSLSA